MLTNKERWRRNQEEEDLNVFNASNNLPHSNLQALAHPMPRNPREKCFCALRIALVLSQSAPLMWFTFSFYPSAFSVQKRTVSVSSQVSYKFAKFEPPAKILAERVQFWIRSLCVRWMLTASEPPFSQVSCEFAKCEPPAKILAETM